VILFVIKLTKSTGTFAAPHIISSGGLNISPTFSHRSPKTNRQKRLSDAVLTYKSTYAMKTLLAIHLVQLVLKAAEHLHTILHSIGHLVK
jgi:hypothetical protein